MKFYKFFVLIILVLFLSSCSHTNELAKYNIRGKTILYNQKVGPLAQQVEIITERLKTDAKEEKKSTLENVLETIATVGTSIASEDVISKLQEDIDTKVMVDYVTSGMKNALNNYLDINEVSSVSDKPEFICNITLETCKLTVSTDNIRISVVAIGTIIDRSTGNIVWENRESITNPIKSTNSNNKKATHLEQDAINFLQLTSLSAEELNTIIGATVDAAGLEMAETLRKDISEMNKK